MTFSLNLSLSDLLLLLPEIFLTCWLCVVITVDFVSPRLPKERLAAFCQERGIRRLSLFGSALRPDFKPDSDIDMLIEFEPGRIPSLLGIARMERELSALLGGVRVDLRTPQD
ncbi:MAG: hypothetical protein HP495_01985, partial [Nitrospira sp.]|nr:hypothetical protein [Nitrospira sp.]